MDLGVGSFVFSQGIVSAAPLIRDPAYLTQPSVRKVLTVVRKCFPLFVLGFLRTLSVKGVEYPVRTFGSMCALMLITRGPTGASNGIRSTLEFFHHPRNDSCSPSAPTSSHTPLPYSLAGSTDRIVYDCSYVYILVFLLIEANTVQQTVLKGGLMEYVLNAPRISLVSSNKEGLVSLMGV